MNKIRDYLLIFITSIMSCSVFAPGFNESNAEYTIIFSAKNLTGDTIVVIDDTDTSLIADKRTFIRTDKFSWVENNEDEDIAIMLEVVKYYLTTTIYFYNLDGKLIDTCLIEPTEKVGDEISSITFENMEIVINEN